MKPLGILQFWLFLLFCSYMSLTPAPPSAVLTVSDKLLHAVGYLALYLSCTLAYPLAAHLLPRLCSLLGYSILIEILQHFIPNRGFSLLDILANAVGLLLGVGVAQIFKRCLPARKPDIGVET
jgi:VanZ family protein